MASKPDYRSAEAESYRKWYKTKRWQDMAKACYLRDRYICQRTGILLIGEHPAPNSPVANHKRKHNGDPLLFWDMDNIETIAKSVHDGAVQREERTGIKAVTIGTDGWPME